MEDPLVYPCEIEQRAYCYNNNMVSIKQFEEDYCLSRHNSSSELTKCSGVPFRGNLSGIRIPLYLFGYQPAKGNDASGVFSCTTEEEHSLLDSLLLAQWEVCSWKGLLKYDVTCCESRVINGSRKFIAQLNVGWNSCCLAGHPLDPFQFDSMKFLVDELLFSVTGGEKANSELIPSAVVPNDANLIFLNANPVEYGHVFIKPSEFNHLPRFLDARSLEMAARVAVEINNYSFHVFYDFHPSSRVNHLLFQACYFANPLPVENVPAVSITGDWQEGWIHICEVLDYPIKALLFKGNGNFRMLAAVVAEICSSLLDHNTPFSLLISECGMQIFLFPQVDTTSTVVCNLSAWECAGHFVFKARCDFDLATEETYVKRLAAASLDYEGFQAVKQLSCRVASKLLS